MKFLRTWSATIVGVDGSPITIGYPRTATFTVTRGLILGLPQLTLKIYNMSPDDRENIFKDYFDYANYFPISFKAGYENEPNIPEIFRGSILYAYNYRMGVDWVTEIQAMDGIMPMRNGQVSLNFVPPWDAKQVLTGIINTMPNASVGAIGTLVMDNTRGRIIFGNSWSEAVKFTYDWGSLFFDKEQVHFLNDTEYIDDGLDPLTINSASGLLNTPRRQDALITFDVLFTPEIEAGRAINLQSQTPEFNGFYIVRGIKHRATISAVMAGEAVSTITLLRADAVTARGVFLPGNQTSFSLSQGAPQ